MFCLWSSYSYTVGWGGQMRGSKRDWACNIPYQTLPLLPRKKWNPIWPFSSRSEKAIGLQSGRYLSWRQGPANDVVDGSMTGKVPSLQRQLKPWLASSSTAAPEWQYLCGWHKGAPSLRPTVALKHSLSILNPQDEMGKAFSQAPDSAHLPARRWAQCLSSRALAKRLSAILLATEVSQFLCEKEAGSTGDKCECHLDHSQCKCECECKCECYVDHSMTAHSWM